MNLLLFITVRWLDILDIVLVAFFISYFYTLVRGTVAMKILIGLLVVLIFWKTTKALQMELVADLIETFIGVGSIAFVIIFQPELRKFLIRIGSNQIAFDLSAKGWFRFSKKESVDVSAISQITVAVENMSQTKTGAIIVIERDSDLEAIASTGTKINAEISTELITSIFFKNNALHDGAVIISNERILAAGCILPNSDRKDLPKSFGLRHRAVLGLSESSNAFIILVSEETGKIMTAYQNKFTENIQLDKLQSQLHKLLLAP
ncbi:diadenylate cyclase CdaA [bacterium SCSIO 12643]|nr:diadenylate cyclase CdaA [bacterium SCSIO 12643]